MQRQNRIALIPGACRPIGRAIARKFAMAGSHLILPIFDWPESIAEMISEFDKSNYSYTVFNVDLRKKEDIDELTSQIKKRFGYIDFLINNIERGGMPVLHGSYDHPHNRDQWDRELDTTLKAKWLLYRSCVPLIQHRDGAAIVNVSSIGAITGRSGPAALFFSDGYSAANRAVNIFTETWAREMSPAVRVNEVMLGLINHRHGRNTRGWEMLSESEKKDIENTPLLKRTGSPEEVAEFIFFIATKATYLTGSTLLMDGGFTLGHGTTPPMPPTMLDNDSCP